MVQCFASKLVFIHHLQSMIESREFKVLPSPKLKLQPVLYINHYQNTTSQIILFHLQY